MNGSRGSAVFEMEKMRILKRLMFAPVKALAIHVLTIGVAKMVGVSIKAGAPLTAAMPTKTKPKKLFIFEQWVMNEIQRTNHE